MLNEHVKKTMEGVKSKYPNGVPVHTGTQTPMGIENVLEAIKDLGETRGWIMKVIIGVYLSTFLEKESPVWLMIVGNPSSNKTTLTDLLKENPNIHSLDTLTSNPFISGQRETKTEKNHDLLPKLDGACFIIKEYGTFFSRSDEMVRQLLGDLTAIYDGEFAKHSPARGTIKHKATFSHIGCVTPQALNKRQKYMNSVGARFLFLRVPTLTDSERTSRLDEYWEEKKNKKTKVQITKLVSDYCSNLREKILEKKPSVSFPKEAQKELNIYANLIARSRGIVVTEANHFETDDGKKQTHYEVVDLQIEEPFRALKQIRKITESLAIIHGSAKVEDQELEIIKKIVLSSMPTRRADIFSVFARGNAFTAKLAAGVLDKNYKTVKRNLDELVALGILNSSHPENQKAREYRIKPEFVSLFPEEEKDLANVGYVQQKLGGDDKNFNTF